MGFVYRVYNIIENFKVYNFLVYENYEFIDLKINDIIKLNYGILIIERENKIIYKKPYYFDFLRLVYLKVNEPIFLITEYALKNYLINLKEERIEKIKKIY